MMDLHRLALWGNCNLALILLSQHPDTDVNLICKQSGQTPLYLACMAGNLEMTDFLLERGASLEQPQSLAGKAPLHTACLHGHLPVAKLLLDKGAQVDIHRRDDGMTPLQIACKYGVYEIAKLQLERGANVTSKTKDGRTPLELACENNQLELVWLLVYRSPWLVMSQDMCFH